MALPAGYYSDEDEDDFGFGDFEDEVNEIKQYAPFLLPISCINGLLQDDHILKRSRENLHNHIDEKERKLDKLFMDVVNGETTEVQNELEDGKARFLIF